MNLARQGVTKLVVLNGHGGNAPALHFAAQMINRDAHIFTCVDTGETSDADVVALISDESSCSTRCSNWMPARSADASKLRMAPFSTPTAVVSCCR